MDKWQAIDAFWNSFEWNAYDESAVPDNATMPYITYSASVASFESPVSLSASLWIHSTSFEEISQKSDEIARKLSPHFIMKLDDGEYVFMTQGTPFSQRVPDENDSVKRLYINVMAEYFTAY